MKIGIFGGSFNPPHMMHLKLALSLIENNIVDKIIFVPNILNPYHEKNLVSKEDRYNMTKMMIDSYPKLEISDIDISKDKQNYAYQTLDQLSSIYPNDELFYIMGSDNLKEIEHWGNYEYLVSTYKIIVIKRGDDNINSIINGNSFFKNNRYRIVPFDKFESFSLSSTEIRNKLFNNDSFKDEIDENVLNYIKTNNLYINL